MELKNMYDEMATVLRTIGREISPNPCHYNMHPDYALILYFFTLVMFKLINLPGNF